MITQVFNAGFQEKQKNETSVRKPAVSLGRSSRFLILPRWQTHPDMISFGKTLQFQNGSGSEHEQKQSASGDVRFDKERKMQVLHIEDDYSIRFIVERFLHNYANLDQVTNGKQALSYIASKRYDAIIADINLGNGIDGIETSRRIRDQSLNKDVPIIAATAYEDSKTRNKCIKVGMNAFLVKPFLRDDLIRVLHEVMKDRF